MDASAISQIIFLIILLIFSAFFSSAETALTTVNKIRMRTLADDGNKRAERVLRITDDSHKMLSAILIGNNIVNLSASSLATTLAIKLWGSVGAGIALVKRVAGLKKEGETDQNVFAEYKAKFVDAISNDLNTSMAITVLYDLLKADTNDITKYELIKDFDKVLSLNLENAKSTETTEGVDAELESFVLAKIEERKEAKKAKDFAKADAIRDELLAKGIVIKDTREGVVWHKAE